MCNQLSCFVIGQECKKQEGTEKTNGTEEETEGQTRQKTWKTEDRTEDRTKKTKELEKLEKTVGEGRRNLMVAQTDKIQKYKKRNALFQSQNKRIF